MVYRVNNVVFKDDRLAHLVNVDALFHRVGDNVMVKMDVSQILEHDGVAGRLAHAGRVHRQ